MEHPIITLTTDWGSRDFFVGMMKGRLLSKIPGVQIVDISHDIEKFDLLSASYVVKHACVGFPPKTIHIIDVDTHIPFVVVEYKEQYFICSDNGLPSIVFGNDFRMAVRLEVRRDEKSFYTFSALKLFTQVAQLLVQGEPIESLGEPLTQLQSKNFVGYTEMPNGLRLGVAYIDGYGNANLNITYSDFERLRAGRKFRIRLRDREYEIKEIVQSYDTPPSNSPARYLPIIATVSITGHLQIALCNQSAQQLIGIQRGTPIIVEWLS